MRTALAALATAVVITTLGVAGEARATVTVTASRMDTLFTVEGDPRSPLGLNCGDLARTMDVDLPYNVVRLHAEDDTGRATAFRWKLPKPNVGFLMPDDPSIMSSAGGAFAVQGFCAQIGSGCVFTEDTINVYRRPTILWAAPRCDTGLPKNTRTQFSGDTVRIRVKAEGQRGRAAKASIDVGYGRLGTPVLWVSDLDGLPDNGIGKKEVVTGLVPAFSVTLESGIMPPLPIEEYFFDNGGGEMMSVAPGACNDSRAATGAVACAVLTYPGVGVFRPRVEARLGDGSGYCDNATARVATCRVSTKLDVDHSPRKKTYRSGDEGEVVVTLHNRAPRRTGCTFIFDQLTCATEAKRGDFEERGQVTFEPARCEGAPVLTCADDVDCGSNGPCLNASHCSQTTTVPCSSDLECSTSECDACEEGERCIRVVQAPPVVNPGESVELLREQVKLRSVLPGKVRITETWSVREFFDRGNDSATKRYKIRGEPLR